MRKLLPSYVVALSLIAVSPAVWAAGSDHLQAHVPEVRHYAATAPKNETAAIAMLDSGDQHIQEYLANKILDVKDMEQIHKVSYSLEAGLDFLRGSPNAEAHEDVLDTLDEAIQSLHHASERHQEDKIRLYAQQLTKNVAQLDQEFTQ